MAYLRIYTDKILTAQHELKSEKLTIGRAADNDIVLEGSSVSKHHAYIEKRGGAFVLVDANSANGVLVNGKRIQSHTLNYRDEIQIFQHTLLFMALAKLPGEAQGASDLGSEQMAQDATIAIDRAVIDDLVKNKRREAVAYVVTHDAAGGHVRHLLEKINFTVGRNAACDLHAGGWLAPGVAGTIQRRGDGHYLVPAWRGQARINDQSVKQATLLKDGDAISIRGVALQFYHRPLDEA